ATELDRVEIRAAVIRRERRRPLVVGIPLERGLSVSGPAREPVGTCTDRSGQRFPGLQRRKLLRREHAEPGTQQRDQQQRIRLLEEEDRGAGIRGLVVVERGEQGEAQSSGQPRFGGGVSVTAVALGPPPVVDAHAATAAAPLNATNSRRFTSPFRLTVRLLMTSLPESTASIFAVSSAYLSRNGDSADNGCHRLYEPTASRSSVHVPASVMSPLMIPQRRAPRIERIRSVPVAIATTLAARSCPRDNRMVRASSSVPIGRPLAS